MSFTFLSRQNPRSRKQRECFWCGEPIPAGERHVYTVGITDFDFSTERFHVECDAAASVFWKTNYDEYVFPGEFKRGTTETKD